MNNSFRKIAKTVLITISASMLFMAVSSIRNNAGIIVTGIVENTDINYEFVSFVMAVGQIFIGLTPPFFGILAEKKGPRFTILLGIVFTVAGLLIAPLCQTELQLLLDYGVLLHGFLGAISFGILTSTLAIKIPEEHQTVAIGVINATGGLGCSVTAPILATAIAAGGLSAGLKISTIIFIGMIPVTFYLCGGRGGNKTEAKRDKELADIDSVSLVKSAAKTKVFWCAALIYGFSGFHMTIITNHITNEIMSFGYDYVEASNIYSFYGLSAIVGAVLSGIICSRFSMEKVLRVIFISHIVICAAYALLPKTQVILCAIVFLLGFTGVASVSPISGILQQNYGVRGLSVFYPICYVVHQFGGFASAWLGGLCFTHFGSYALFWTIDCVFAVIAVVLSYQLKPGQSS